MKHVLVVTYYFPPMPVAGAVRLSYLAKYLPRFGWEPTVVTRTFPGASDNGTAVLRGPVYLVRNPQINASAEQLRRNRAPLQAFIATLKGLVHFPDAAIGWVPGAVRRGLAITKEHRFDAVLSSALPGTAHVAANIIARRRGLPWLADYRDLWHGHPYTTTSPQRGKLEWELERRLIRRASALTTVNEHIAGELARMHGRRDVTVIENGYDPAEWSAYDGIEPPEFRLTYAGALYDGLRTPDIAFEAAAILRARNHPAGRDVRFEFFTDNVSVVEESAERHGVRDIVRLRGVQSRETVKSALRASAGALIILRMADFTATELGSKIGEIYGARRPTIAIGPPLSVVREAVESADMGWFVSSAHDCADAIVALHDRYRAGVYEPPASDGWRPPTAEAIAERFAAVLDGMVAGSSTRPAALHAAR